MRMMGKNAFSLVGEMALIDDEPRSATVVALRACQLLRLSSAALFQLAEFHPLVYRQSLRLLSSFTVSP